MIRHESKQELARLAIHPQLGEPKLPMNVASSSTYSKLCGSLHDCLSSVQALAEQLAHAQAMPKANDASSAGSTHGMDTSLKTVPDVKATLIVAPTECYSHRTCPEPISRDGPDVPPENVNRLKVLTHPGSFYLFHSPALLAQPASCSLLTCTVTGH